MSDIPDSTMGLEQVQTYSEASGACDECHQTALTVYENGMVCTVCGEVYGPDGKRIGRKYFPLPVTDAR